MVRVLCLTATTALALAATVRADVNPPVIAVPVDTTPATQAAPEPGVVVRLSSTQAGARNVVLTIGLPVGLRCGHALGAVRIVLPRTVAVPARVSTRTVIVNGERAGRVSVAGHSIVVAAAKPPGRLCNSIVEGRMTLRFTAAAGLANPASAGVYDLAVRRGTAVYTVRVRIHSA